MFSGKGSDEKKSFVRMLSERSLVRKISQLMEHQELSTGSAVSFVAGTGSADPSVDESAEDPLGDSLCSASCTVTPSLRLSVISREEPSNQIPSLHRRELMVGKLLGQ